MSQLKVGDKVDHFFIVVSVSEKLTRGGKTYLSLDVRNRFISCNTKIWDWEQKITLHRNMAVGEYVKVQGVVEEYAGINQIKLQVVFMVDESDVDMADIVEVPNKPLEDLESELWNYFINKPAASKNHHATQHGLLEHTVSMMALAVKVQQHYHFLSLDLLLAGCLWHDIGKALELNNVLKGGYTTEGQLIGHINLGISLIDQILVSERNDVINGEEINFLKHMILSHHGKQEWGSPIKPAIPEAEALHMIDMMDATMYKLFRHMKDAPVGEWVSHSILQGRYLKHSLHEMDDKDYYRS